MTFFSERRQEDLAAQIRNRLEAVPLSLIRRHAAAVDHRIEQERSPLTSASLRDLLNKRLFVQTPYAVESRDISGEPYTVLDTGPCGMAAALLQDKNILLLGGPGHGKSTAALLCFRELARVSESRVAGDAPLFASLRRVLGHAPDGALPGDQLCRVMFSLPESRTPWPQSLQLPAQHWLLILDGADESGVIGERLGRLLDGLTAKTHVLVTCREHA